MRPIQAVAISSNTKIFNIVEQIWYRDIMTHPHKEAYDFFTYMNHKCNLRTIQSPRGDLLLRSIHPQGSYIFDVMIRELKELIVFYLQSNLTAAGFTRILVNSLSESENYVTIWKAKS